MRLAGTLFGRLLIIFLIFGTVMTGALLAVMQISHRVYHLEFDQTVNRQLARQYVDAQFFLADRPLTAASLHWGIAKLAAANPAVDIYLIDGDGTIVASSVPAAQWRRRRIDMRPIHDFLGGRAAPILAEDPRDPQHREVFSAAPLKIADCPADFLYIVLRRDQHQPGAAQLRTAYSVGEGAGFVAIAAILSVVLSLIFLRLLTRRLGVLEDSIRRFRDEHGIPGVGEIEAPIAAGDEVDRLEALFGDLTRRIVAQLEALKATDVMRRDLLANVSHDLRTPLTTLLAHLETLQMKPVELKPEERARYIEVAMQQARRIGRLVEQLLEAARLEAGQVTPSLEPLPIGELIHDVVQKFSLVARDRQVTLAADVAAEPTLVNIDIALLERALDNLIDNALRHTPAGGHVTVCSERRGDRVRVTVLDTGPGLTPIEADRVFVRFYRGDRGRCSPSGHAGLGLAIVKSILELHGGAVAVDSQPGQGAAFYFELPIIG